MTIGHSLEAGEQGKCSLDNTDLGFLSHVPCHLQLTRPDPPSCRKVQISDPDSELIVKCLKCPWGFFQGRLAFSSYRGPGSGESFLLPLQPQLKGDVYSQGLETHTDKTNTPCLSLFLTMLLTPSNCTNLPNC